MGKCYLCGKRVWPWQRRAWHSDSWGFVLIQDMGDDAHLFRICHETCAKDKVRVMEKERLSRPRKHNIISREHNPPEDFTVELVPDFTTDFPTKKEIQDDFNQEDDLE